MKLATLRNGGRDGRLVVVSREKACTANLKPVKLDDTPGANHGPHLCGRWRKD